MGTRRVVGRLGRTNRGLELKKTLASLHQHMRPIGEEVFSPNTETRVTIPRWVWRMRMRTQRIEDSLNAVWRDQRRKAELRGW